MSTIVGLDWKKVCCFVLGMFLWLPGDVNSAIIPNFAGGGNHSVAVMPDGTVRTWGANTFGQLGNGSTASSSTPMTVNGLGGTVRAVAAGSSHTVALMSDGTVKAWGSNSFGQLGNGTATPSSTPVTVSGLGGTVTSVAAGLSHSVALMSDGTIRTWGLNASGQLGDGTTTSSSTPVTVNGLGGTVVAVTAGNFHTVALMADGTLKSWGSNNFAQLGDGTMTYRTTPVAVTGLGGTVTSIAAGAWHTVAFMSDSTLKAWGSNASGQLGNGTTTSSSTPVTVNGLGGTVTAMTAGLGHTVVLMSDGTVKTWGDNTSGSLGDGTWTLKTTPVAVTGLGGTVTAIATGWGHTVALMADGTVKAWGENAAGELGDGTRVDRNLPVTVSGLIIAANGVPAAPTMILSTQGLNVSVFWSPLASATGYTLCYAPYPWMPWMTMNDIVYANVGSTTNFSIDLWQGAAYYVAMQAYGAQGSSDFSNINYFVMGP